MDPTDEILDIIHEGGPDTLSRIAEIVCGCEKQTQTLTDEEIDAEAHAQNRMIGYRYWDDWFRAGARFGESKVRAGTLTDPTGGIA